jgi:hypothetical protein
VRCESDLSYISPGCGYDFAACLDDGFGTGNYGVAMIGFQWRSCCADLGIARKCFNSGNLVA